MINDSNDSILIKPEYSNDPKEQHKVKRFAHGYSDLLTKYIEDRVHSAGENKFLRQLYVKFPFTKNFDPLDYDRCAHPFLLQREAVYEYINRLIKDEEREKRNERNPPLIHENETDHTHMTIVKTSPGKITKVLNPRYNAWGAMNQTKWNEIIGEDQGKIIIHDKHTGEMLYQHDGDYYDIKHKGKEMQTAIDAMYGGKKSESIPGMVNYKMGSTQANLPMLLSYTALRVQKDLVPNSEAVKYEKDPHVTILYGLSKFLNYSDMDEIREAVKGIKPFVIKFGLTYKFEGVENGTQDVVFQSVSDSLGVGGLNGLRRRIEPFLDSSFKDSSNEGREKLKPYVAHMTLAYVALGDGKKYANRETELTGENLLVSSFEVRFANGAKGTVQLT